MSNTIVNKGVGKNRENYNRFFPYKALLYADRIERIVADEFPAPVVWHVYPSNVFNVTETRHRNTGHRARPSACHHSRHSTSAD